MPSTTTVTVSIAPGNGYTYTVTYSDATSSSVTLPAITPVTAIAGWSIDSGRWVSEAMNQPGPAYPSRAGYAFVHKEDLQSCVEACVGQCQAVNLDLRYSEGYNNCALVKDLGDLYFNVDTQWRRAQRATATAASTSTPTSSAADGTYTPSKAWIAGPVFGGLLFICIVILIQEAIRRRWARQAKERATGYSSNDEMTYVSQPPMPHPPSSGHDELPEYAPPPAYAPPTGTQDANHVYQAPKASELVYSAYATSAMASSSRNDSNV